MKNSSRSIKPPGYLECFIVMTLVEAVIGLCKILGFIEVEEPEK